MCLIREELAVVAADALQGSRDLESEYTETKSVYERLIPRDTAAFVKELLTVAKPDKRCVNSHSVPQGAMGSLQCCTYHSFHSWGRAQ
jgi:hypothetical protein